MRELACMMWTRISSEGCVFTCGNGGSAAQAAHLTAELMGRYNRDRDPIKSVCLNADATLMTCIANDFGYEEVFRRQIQGLAGDRDVLVVFTTSGKSKNVLAAIAQADVQGLMVVMVTGPTMPPKKVVNMTDVIINSSGFGSGVIQQNHMTFIHHLMDRIEELHQG